LETQEIEVDLVFGGLSDPSCDEIGRRVSRFLCFYFIGLAETDRQL
jgi:hypothetical protein